MQEEAQSTKPYSSDYSSHITTTSEKDKKMNCWEFKKCGREKGGKNAEELGICPAYPDHGTHCAHVAGTFCKGEVQGTFAQKKDCRYCSFFYSENYDREYLQ